MSYISNKALIIAVSLMITMAIASSVLYILNQTKQVYKTVYETDTSIQSRFDEFDTYDGAEKTGVDFINVVKKYLDSDVVYVCKFEENAENIPLNKAQKYKYNNSEKKDTIGEGMYAKTYITSVKRYDDGKVLINFKEKN